MKIKVTTRTSAGTTRDTFEDPEWDGSEDGHALAILKSGDIKEVVIRFAWKSSITYRIVQEGA